jgi:hypothetical protein
MNNSRTCCRVPSPRDRRPIRAAYRPRPKPFSEIVDAEYLAGRLTLAQARDLLPGFIPEYALATDLNEVLDLMRDEATGPPDDLAPA